MLSICLEHDGNAFLLAGQRHRAWDGWNRGYGHWNRDVPVNCIFSVAVL